MKTQIAHFLAKVEEFLSTNDDVYGTSFRSWSAVYDKEGDMIRKGSAGGKRKSTIMPAAFIWDMDLELRTAVEAAVVPLTADKAIKEQIIVRILGMVREHPYEINKATFAFDVEGQSYKIFIDIGRYKVLLNNFIILINKLYTNEYMKEEVFKIITSFFIKETNE